MSSGLSKNLQEKELRSYNEGKGHYHSGIKRGVGKAEDEGISLNGENYQNRAFIRDGRFANFG